MTKEKRARFGAAAAIMDRRTAEEALQRERDFISAVVDTVAALVIVLDRQGRITRFNRACERLTGYTYGEVKNKFYWELLVPEETEAVKAVFVELRAGRFPSYFENYWLTRDGERRLIAWSNTTLQFEDTGQPEFIIGTGIDITAQRAAETTFRAEEQHAINDYERLLDRLASLAQTFGTARNLPTIFRALREFAEASTPASTILLSLSDEERGTHTVVYACVEGEEINLPPPLLSHRPHHHHRAEASDETSSASSSSPADGDHQQQQAVAAKRLAAFHRESNSPSSTLVAPMNFMGRTLGAIEIRSPHHHAAFGPGHATAIRMAANLAAVAIGNVRLLERELERAEQQAEIEKMRSLGQLAAGVAHDFNNSLAAILGRTQLLLRAATDDDKQRRNLEVIETAALDAADTVRRIQTFARRTPGEQFKSVSVAKIINDAIQLTRTRWEDDARARGLHYDIRFTPVVDDDGDQIMANPSELREVLVNLIFNSLDAMPRSGRIEISERKVDGFITIEVADTGMGVEPALIDRIFEPFFTTKGQQGSGLGLAVSYGIISRHAGTIEVKSTLGRGTTFVLRLPQTTSAAAPIAAARRIDLPTRRVLVVDDEEVVREVLVEMLRELQQEVTAVESGAAALGRLGASTFDLMITDLSMAAMDGLTLAVQARRRAPHMLIALATGYGQTIPGGPPDPALIDLIVNKPFQITDLESSLLMLYTHV